jgi:serine/threonine protein kinase
MQPTVSHPQESEPAAHKIAKSVSDLIADWSPGEVFDAHQVLDENPEFKDDHSVVLDLAYEEYCRRTESGEDIDLSEFVARFPAVETPLLDLIDVHQVLYDNPSVLTNGVAPRWPEVGESHLDLKLLEKIGSGSFSQVYIASESGVGERRVVAKLCTNAHHEASLLGRLEHPNIVPILSVKTDRQKNLSAICMPYMSRTTLAHAIEFLHGRGRQATPGDLVGMLFDREHVAVSTSGQESGFCRRSQLQDLMVDIAIQLCRGLEFAHSRGVIHGDLKPSNILLTKQGTALLMDFNLSQQLRPESQALGGTLSYMAPEQLAILGQSHRQPHSVICNEQTDVYSIGILLTELFTGSHPFCKDSRKRVPAESARKLFEQQQAKPITARELAPAIGMSLAKIIEKCLVLDPRQRWGDVQALRAALEQTMTAKNRTLRWLRRERKRVFGVSAALCVSLTAASLLYASLPYESEKLVDSALIAMNQDRPGNAVDDLILASELEATRLGTTKRETKSLLVEAYSSQASRLLKDGHYQQAIAQLKAAHRLAPSSESVRQSLLDACLESGATALNENRASQAVADYSEARELAPDSPDVLWRLSRALLADRRFDAAVEAAYEWRSLEPENARSVANLAYCYFKQGEPENDMTAFLHAQTEFQKALTLTGNVSRAAIHSNIGLCFLKLGPQKKQAINSFTEATNISPEFVSPEDLVVPCVLLMKVKLSLAYADPFNWRRQYDLSWIEDYVAKAPESSELLIEAACWYAFASAKSLPDSEESEQYLEQCIDYCHRASALGMTELDLKQILSCQSRLKEHRDWPLLMALTIEKDESEGENLLLEPLL